MDTIQEQTKAWAVTRTHLVFNVVLAAYGCHNDCSWFPEGSCVLGKQCEYHTHPHSDLLLRARVRMANRDAWLNGNASMLDMCSMSLAWYSH